MSSSILTQPANNVQRNVNIRLSRSPPGTCWQTIVLKCSPHQDSHYQTFPFRKCENVFILETALETKKNYSMLVNVQSWRRYCDRFWDVEEAEGVRKLRIDDLSQRLRSRGCLHSSNGNCFFPGRFSNVKNDNLT